MRDFSVHYDIDPRKVYSMLSQLSAEEVSDRFTSFFACITDVFVFIITLYASRQLILTIFSKLPNIFQLSQSFQIHNTPLRHHPRHSYLWQGWSDNFNRINLWMSRVCYCSSSRSSFGCCDSRYCFMLSELTTFFPVALRKPPLPRGQQSRLFLQLAHVRSSSGDAPPW